jgi:siroheme synthase (precorrin-2 oxidase/ferrochelatase)
MFIELSITNIAILNYHRRKFLPLRFENKIKVFAFRQKFMEKYFMQTSIAEKS